MQRQNQLEDNQCPSVETQIKRKNRSEILPVYEEIFERDSYQADLTQSFYINIIEIGQILDRTSITTPKPTQPIVNEPPIDEEDINGQQIKNEIIDPKQFKRKDYILNYCQNQLLYTTFLLIVASQQKIKQIKLGKQTQQSGQKVVCSSYQYKNFNIYIGLVSVSPEELQTHEIKYKQITTKLFVFKSGMSKVINFIQMDRKNLAGILMNQTIKQQQNVDLRNYCLLLANQIIAKNAKRINSKNKKIQEDFYKLMLATFRLEITQIGNIFDYFSICNTQSIYTQYFLYFFYHLFKNNAVSLIHQYNLLSKLTFTQTSCKDVIINKYYKAFELGNELKLFYLQICLLYSLQHWKQEDAVTILKINLQHQSKLKSKEIMKNIINKKSKIVQYLDNGSNILLITNEHITFNQYLQIKIKYLQFVYEECSYKKNLEKFNEEALGALTYLLEKVRKNNQIEENTLNQSLIEQLAFVVGKVTMTESHSGLFYTQWKCLFSIVPQLKQPIYKVIWPLINEKIPILMKANIMEIIYPLIIKPQIPDQIILLLNYFQKQQLTSEILQFLLNLLIQPHHTLYNYRTINNLLITSLAHNKSIANINLTKLTDLMSKQIKKQNTSKNMRQQILLLSKQIINEMKPHPNKKDIIEWYQDIIKSIQ